MKLYKASCYSFLLSSGAFALHTLPPSIQKLRQQIVDPNLLQTESQKYPRFPAYNLSVPVDHFHNDSLYAPHTEETFPLRYWFDASFYEPGGPVIILGAGETDGADRLPLLEHGIVHKLAKATHGIAVVLEHRYYGESFPVQNLSTESLRFLSTQQAMADTAYFAQNIVFPGLEDDPGNDSSSGSHPRLTAPHTPYIVYGGSYAGGLAAFLRIVYPDIFWGAIASSGVTAAVYDFWDYYEAARRFAPGQCSPNTQQLISVVDTIMMSKSKDKQTVATKRLLQESFSLGGLSHAADFAQVLAEGISQLQATNWDPLVSSPEFSFYCGNITSSTYLYRGTLPDGDHHGVEKLEATVRRLLEAGGMGEEKLDELVIPMMNFMGYVNATSVQNCLQRENPPHGGDRDQVLESCFTHYNRTFYQQDDISQRWRSWPYQYCTQWGYFQTGSGVPPTQLPLISRMIDINYTTMICRESFPGKEDGPDLDAINVYGNYDLRYPRVAIIDGERDPWRAATPNRIGLPARPSTIEEPVMVIPGGVHHWDANGVSQDRVTDDFPPPEIRAVQAAEIHFVREWLKEWKENRDAIQEALPQDQQRLN